LKQLAFQAFQMNLRHEAGADSASFGDPARIAGIRLVPAYPEEFAELSRLIQIDRIAEAPQAPGEADSGSRLKADSGASAPLHPPELAVDVVDRGPTGAFLKDRSQIVDDTDSRRFGANVETGPDLPGHG
jgi:hypothetical protein